jgi:hypothetical protein
MRHALLLLLCFVLQACGAIKLTYNNADTLIYFWLDGYVDITLDQKVRVKDELLALQHWHRKTQLPIFVTMTQTLQKQIVSDVTPALLCSNADQATALLPALNNYLEPSVLWLATNLSTDQIAHMEKKFDKTNKEWRKDWMPSKKEDLMKKTEKSLRERLDPLYGKPTEAQLKLLRSLMAESPFDAKVAYAERLRVQKDLLDTLKTVQSRQLGIEAAKAPMRQFLDRVAESPDPNYRAYSARIKQHNCNLFAKLHNSMSIEQRADALEKLKQYELDFKTLQAPR